jgi:hypothetical protein
MSVAYSWPEGQIYVYTGNAATSAVVAFATDSNVTPLWGWDNRVAADGSYNDHLTGRRMNVTVGAIYTMDTTLQRIADSATAIHMKFLHMHYLGSAGIWLWSGRIDSLPLNGADTQPYAFSLQAHFNRWSAF